MDEQRPDISGAAGEAAASDAHTNTAAENRPAIADLGEAIARAEQLVRRAQERREQRRRLRELLAQLEEQVRLAIHEEDQDGASWLRGEIEKVRASAGQLRAVRVPQQAPDTSAAPAPPATGNGGQAPAVPLKPPPIGEVWPTPPVSKHVAELRHWQDRWNELVEWVLSGTRERTDPAWALRARAVLLGAHSFVVRYGGDRTEAGAVSYARRLVAAIREQIVGMGNGPENKIAGPGGNHATLDAHVLRQLSDGYFRSATASQILAQQRELPSLDEDRRRQCVSAALVTLQYHRHQLAGAALQDQVLDETCDAAQVMASELGISGLTRSELQAAAPPLTSKQLGAFLEKAAASAEEGEVAPDAREAAIQRVLALVRSRPDFGADPSRLAEDREAVVPRLQQAFSLGVPPSHKEIRDSILDRWYTLLDGLEGFEVFLREVDAEIDRRASAKEAGDKTDRGSERDMSLYAARLRPILQGKRVLLLGGVPRVHTAPKLREALGCAEVLWPEARRTDDAGKFEAEMRRADVIVIVKNFARHAIGELASRVARERERHCIFLTAGYGVAQILAQMDAHFEQRGMIATA